MIFRNAYCGTHKLNMLSFYLNFGTLFPYINKHAAFIKKINSAMESISISTAYLSYTVTMY